MKKRTLKLQHTGLLFLALAAPPGAIAADAPAEQGKPAGTRSSGLSEVQILVKKAIEYSKDNDYYNAVQNFNKALTLDPKSFDSWFGRGWSLRQMGDFAGAIQDYDKAIALQPKRAQVYVNRGWCHNRLGHEEQAMKDFNRALEIDPNYLNAYKNRGSLKLKTGDYQGAIADFNQLLMRDPNAQKEVAKLVTPMLGGAGGADKIADHSSKLAQLAGSLKGTSIKIEDTELAQLNNRAARAIKAGEFANAIQVLEILAKKNPNYSFAKDNLAIAYNNQGLKMAQDKPNESLAQFRRALFFSPNEETTRTNLNAVLEAQGKDPDSDAVRLALGEELEAQGDNEGAFVEYMEAMRLKNSPTARVKVAQICAKLELPTDKRALHYAKKTTENVKIDPLIALAPAAAAYPAAAPAPSGKMQTGRVSKIGETADETTAAISSPENTSASGEDKPAASTDPLAAKQDDERDPINDMIADAQRTFGSGPAPRKARPKAAARSSRPPAEVQRTASDTIIDTGDKSEPEASTVNALKNSTTIASNKSLIATRSAEAVEPVELVLPPAEPLTPAKKPRIGHDLETLRLEWKTRVHKGDELFDQGNYLDSEGDYRRSLTIARKLGSRSEELASSLERLSRIFLVQKRTVEALSLLEQTYAMRREILAADDPLVVKTGDKVLSLRHMLYPEKSAKQIKEEEEAELAADDMAPDTKMPNEKDFETGNKFKQF